MGTHAIQGKHYVAKRAPDDEVYFVPNVYVIHEVDFEDHENYIASDGLKEYAIEHGWYNPEEPLILLKCLLTLRAWLPNPIRIVNGVHNFADRNRTEILSW